MDEGAVAQRCGVVRVLVADDLPVVREGFTLLLDAVEGFKAVGCASNSDALLRAVRDWTPDVVLVDTTLGGEDGCVIVQRIKLRHPGVGVLLFPMEISEEPLERAIACGVNGVILKNAPVSEVLDAIGAVAQGGFVLGSDLAEPAEPPRFSPREREVLRLLAAGLNNREISQTLFISVGTTKSHLERIARKLGTSHRAAAVAEAMRRGLVG